MKKFSHLQKNARVLSTGFTADKRPWAKDRTIQQHWHNYYELEIITDGAIKHTINKETSTIRRGDLYFLTPIDCHMLSGVEDAQILNISFTDDMIDTKLRQYLNSPIPRCYNLSTDDFDYIESRGEQLLKESKSNLFNTEIASAIITEIFYLLMRTLSFKETSSSSPSLLQSVISIINKRYFEDININSLAQDLFVSPQYLGKVFKEQMNISLKDYITNLRLKHACHLLIHTDIPIKEVAMESGYSSAEYFLYVFKKNINTTPGAYRQNNKAKD